MFDQAARRPRMATGVLPLQGTDEGVTPAGRRGLAAMRVTIMLAGLAASLAPVPAWGQSLYFGVNQPAQYDFADLSRLPPDFGVGEFAFELWVKPDRRFPVGDTDRGTRDQMTHWSAYDLRPYADHEWWYPGNWLLDGHSRPRGFGPGDSRAGTFSLQFYGGGRLRWMFADSDTGMPPGMVHNVQAPDTRQTPSLLDGRWHHIVAVRRWRQPSGATLELWIDGRRVGATDIPQRVNMRRYWDAVPHPDDPPNLGGWAFGAEVMTAWNFYFNQYEDYKGWMDELRLWSRALTPVEIEQAARGVREGRPRGLVGRFSFSEGRGAATCDAYDPRYCMTLHRARPDTWSAEDAPRAAPDAG